MAISRFITAPLGRAMQTVGRYNDYVLPGQGSSRVTNAGRSITDRNQVYTGGSPFDGQASWVQVQNPVTQTTNNQSQATGNNTQDNNQMQDYSAWSSTGRSGGSAPAINPADIMAAQDVINQANFALSQLGGQRNVFNSNLDNTFANYRSKLDNSFNRYKGDYEDNRKSTINEQQQAKSKIDQQVRMRANALQRLLGAAGGGDSQAAYELAPYAAARTGSQMRADINNQYGKNLQSLDQGWGRYNTDYQNNLLELSDQRENKRREQEQAFANTEAQARENLAKGQSALSYAQGGSAEQSRAIREAALPMIYQILQRITDLGAQQVSPVIKDASYTAPELAQYTTENANDVQGVDQQLAQEINPYYQLLLKKGQEDQSFGY